MDETWERAWRRVRSWRASPLGHCALSSDRRAVHSAAIEQAEQFATAAHSVGPATRPVLLFYALSQAGRAIAADLATGTWRIRGHGARSVLGPHGGCPLDASFSASASDGGPVAGAYRTVAEATGSAIPVGPVSLAELWASLPELERLSAGRDWLPGPRPLRFKGNGITPHTGPPDAGAVMRAMFTQADFQSSPASLREALPKYPMADGFEIREIFNGWARATVVVWPDATSDMDGLRVLHDVAESWRGDHYLRPSLGSGRTTPSLLMTWWALLLLLSSLARYEPERWRAALDPDRSPLATALEEILVIAELRVPQLIDSALATPRANTARELLAKDGEAPFD